MRRPEFVPANRYTPAELAALFTRGYEGYYVPMTLDAATFEHMARLCDHDLARSRVALIDGEPAGIAVLAVRGDRGWVGGMGVVPEARGHGLGATLMHELLSEARALGLRSVDLEVLVQNAPAIRIYESLGFRRTRGLGVWSLDPREVAAPDRAVATLDSRRCLDAYEAFHPTRAPWQRDRATLEHVSETLQAFGCAANSGVEGWVLYRVTGARGNIADLVSIPDGAGARCEALLAALMRAHPGVGFRLLNLPEDDPAAPALRALGGRVDERQHEMTITP